MWYVMKSGERVSKGHESREAAMVEAFEMGAVLWIKGRKYLADGYALMRV